MSEASLAFRKGELGFRYVAWSNTVSILLVTLGRSIAALPQSLQEIELDSTSSNACCKENVARNKFFFILGNFSCNLCRSNIAGQDRS